LAHALDDDSHFCQSSPRISAVSGCLLQL
jgi:hypothetical protein